jgi:integration host factor subunit alpha
LNRERFKETKAKIVEAVARQVDLPRIEVVELVDGLFEMIREGLEQGADVKFPGFGKFSVREKRERVERNPKTGESIAITARKVVTFKASQKLKGQVDGNNANG